MFPPFWLDGYALGGAGHECSELSNEFLGNGESGQVEKWPCSKKSGTRKCLWPGDQKCSAVDSLVSSAGY